VEDILNMNRGTWRAYKDSGRIHQGKIYVKTYKNKKYRVVVLEKDADQQH
jgi:hypothetical protein